MNYGWFSTGAGGTQRNGIFVDDDNRILFWPDKKSPGYVVDEEKALALIETRKNPGSHAPTRWPRHHVGRYAVWLILLFTGVSVGSFLAFSNYDNTALNIYFSPLGLIGTIGLLFVLGLIFPIFLADRAMARRKMLPILSGSPKIDLARPPRQFLKFTENGWSKLRFYCSVLLLLVMGNLLLWSATSRLISGTNLADSVLFLLLAVSVVVLLSFVIYVEISGAKLSDVRVYNKTCKPVN